MASSPESQTPTQHLTPIALWLGSVALVFFLLNLGWSYLADSYPADSPASIDSATLSEVTTEKQAYPKPDFRLASLDGPPLGPPDYLGKVVVIDLWATWCGPCRLQAQHLEQLHTEYGDQVQFLAIDVGEDEQTVRSYVEKTPFPYPVLLDPEETLQRRFGSTGLPTVMVVDVSGEVSFLQVGVTAPATLRREIAAAQQPRPAS